MNKIEKLEKLVTEYEQQHPKGQNPFEWIGTFGVDAVIEKIEEAGGREIYLKLPKVIVDDDELGELLFK